MNTSSCLQHVVFDHAYQLQPTRHDSCYSPNEDTLARGAFQQDVAIKSELLESQTECVAKNVEVDNFFVKQEYEDFGEEDSMLGTDILNPFEDQLEGSSSPYCGGIVNLFNDNFCASNGADREVIIKTEQTNSIVKQEYEDFEGETFALSIDALNCVKNEFENHSVPYFDFFGLNATEQEVTVITEPTDNLEEEKANLGEDTLTNKCNTDNLDNEEVLDFPSPIKTEPDLERLQNEEVIKDETFAKEDCECDDEMITTNVKEKLNLNPRLKGRKYCVVHAGDKSSKFYSGEKLSKVKQTQHSSEKPAKCISGATKQTQNGRTSPGLLTVCGDKTKMHFRCSVCNYNSSKRDKFCKHLKIHKKNILHKCSKCEYSSLDRRLLHQHLTTHSKAYRCTKCKYRASRQLYLDVHMKTHLNSPYKCYECEYTATQRSTVTRHFNAVHLNL